MVKSNPGEHPQKIGQENTMEALIRAMAKKVDNDEAEGYLVTCCTKDAAGDHEVMTGARAAKQFAPPYQLYARLLGKLFHTITQGHSEPQKLLQRLIEAAVKEFSQTIKNEDRAHNEFTVVGKL
jgi:hypothetical protein